MSQTPEQTPELSPGKGRPTPTRKEAEAARKATLKIPSDPKAARKAARARQADERARAREALVSGDERNLPPRDAGPVRKFTRDFVDGRWNLSELFLPLAMLVLVMGFIRNPEVQRIVSISWLLLTVLIIVDLITMQLTLKSRLKAQWPDKADRKGVAFYATMRALQIRRLRLPPPKVRRGGKPVQPKAAKQKASS